MILCPWQEPEQIYDVRFNYGAAYGWFEYCWGRSPMVAVGSVVDLPEIGTGGGPPPAASFLCPDPPRAPLPGGGAGQGGGAAGPGGFGPPLFFPRGGGPGEGPRRLFLVPFLF